MIKAHEIQGILALENSFNRVGLDHVLLVRVATAAVATAMLGGNKEQIISALSNAWTDGGALRLYRHAPNTGPRKSWAAGDATSRGVRLALMAMQGEMGYPSALTAKNWGFYDVLFKGKPFILGRPLGSYVMENVLFKISFPAEFHAQTAVECAFQLHEQVKDRLEQIDKSHHHHPGIGDPHHRQVRAAAQSRRPRPLHSVHDRRRFDLRRAHRRSLRRYDRPRSAHRCLARQNDLRRRSAIFARTISTREKRSIANAVQVFFKDGSSTEKVAVEYPIGHRRRRAEGMPLLVKKFEANLASRFAPEQCDAILRVCKDAKTLDATPVDEFTDMFVKLSRVSR